MRYASPGARLGCGVRHPVTRLVLVMSEWQFAAAMRIGRHKGSGRQILPLMPVSALGRMTDADLVSIFTYLRSIPAIDNAVPEAIISSGADRARGARAVGAPTGAKGRTAAAGCGRRACISSMCIGCTEVKALSRLSDRASSRTPIACFLAIPPRRRYRRHARGPAPWVMHMTSTQASSGPWASAWPPT